MFVNVIHAAADSNRSLVLVAVLYYIVWIDHNLLTHYFCCWAFGLLPVLGCCVEWRKSDTLECVLCDSIIMATAVYGFKGGRECLGGEMREALCAGCLLFLNLDTETGCVHFVIMWGLCSSTFQLKSTPETQNLLRTKLSNIFLLLSTATKATLWRQASWRQTEASPRGICLGYL